MRLARYIAHAGVASRRAAEELIRAGRVTVDGAPVQDPAIDVSDDRRVAVDGRVLDGPESRAVYVVHKPVGVLSTVRDTHGRPTVVELVPADARRLYPVGRLDADTSGLMLLTNDGELAHRLTHPRFEVPRTYRAVVGGPPLREAALSALRRGVELEEGLTAPARARRLGPHELELTLHEGRKRQVRRMCDAVGHPVRSLIRVRFGPITLGRLAPGAQRRLSEAEISRLRAASGRRPGRSSSGTL
jgi:23S rRNA pseudouridine2605 synthase